MSTCWVPDIQFHSLHVGKSCANPVTKTKLTLMLALTLTATLTLLTLLTLLNPTNPSHNSKTMKLTCFRQTSPQNRKPSRRCHSCKRNTPGNINILTANSMHRCRQLHLCHSAACGKWKRTKTENWLSDRFGLIHSLWGQPWSKTEV